MPLVGSSSRCDFTFAFRCAYNGFMREISDGRMKWRLERNVDRPANHQANAPWWRHFKQKQSRELRYPTASDQPQLPIGTIVLLKGKPDRPRRVLAAEWHHFQHQFVYIIETRGQRKHPPFCPYWFLDQLEVIDG
jgi:hypothetical protein